jgi:hypothetical protein
MSAKFDELLTRLERLTCQVEEVRRGLRDTVVIAEMAPDMAVTKARKVLEYIVRDVYQRRLTEPAGTRPLENLLQRLVKDGFFPVRLDAYANTVRKLGNLGTHNFDEPVTPDDVYHSLTHLVPILEWYFEVERDHAGGTSRETAEADGPVRVESPGARPARVAIVPKGLRAFDARDRDFFLQLLPGPFDQDGLPESLRFWKHRIEARDEVTFTVGVLYGPSGCGKSSLLGAGLLPRLDPAVIVVYVEATANDTELRLLAALRKHFGTGSGVVFGRTSNHEENGLPENDSRPLSPQRPPSPLLDTLTALRQGQGIPAGRKVLIVLDQFEQWLHARASRPDSELVPALRQCDGGHVQCLVTVRDDFWLQISRFMADLGIEILQGQNTALVDLFDPLHARQVLTEFGRAYGRLPDDPQQHSADQASFLTQAISQLSEDGKVVSVRLALFAEMVKGREWVPATLQAVGGVEGLGVTFLEETFSSSTANPKHRMHQTAARRVLKALLPETGADIKGNMRPQSELLAASGYADRPTEFDALLRILNGELRLITPTDPEGADREPAKAATASSDGQYYQLTHDYLVPSLREWLTRKQKETRRGRAELRLAERAAAWNVKPENRHLPSWWEYVNIRCLTRKNTWTEPQTRMMRQAGRRLGTQWGSGLVMALVVLFVVLQVVSSVRKSNLQVRMETAVAAMSTSRGVMVPRSIEDLAPLPPDRVLAELRRRFADSQDERRLALAYALAHFGDVRVDFLISQIATAAKEEVDNLVAALGHEKDAAVVALRAASERSESDLTYKGRLAVVALHLGEALIASDMCQLRADPVQRTHLIHRTLPAWHGDVARLVAVADASENPLLRYAISLGIAEIPAEGLTIEARETWQSVLLK